MHERLGVPALRVDFAVAARGSHPPVLRFTSARGFCARHVPARARQLAQPQARLKADPWINAPRHSQHNTGQAGGQDTLHPTTSWPSAAYCFRSCRTPLPRPRTPPKVVYAAPIMCKYSMEYRRRRFHGVPTSAPPWSTDVGASRLREAEDVALPAHTGAANLVTAQGPAHATPHPLARSAR